MHPLKRNVLLIMAVGCGVGAFLLTRALSGRGGGATSSSSYYCFTQRGGSSCADARADCDLRRAKADPDDRPSSCQAHSVAEGVGLTP
jgi:hypothetical protein